MPAKSGKKKENFSVEENGRVVTTATKATWRQVVKGLNSSADCVDAPYSEIVVKDSKNRIVYRQKGG